MISIVNPPDVAASTVTIGEAERRSGVPKDTLRVWERRYGFPTPVRDGSGDRTYTLEQVEKLRLIRILIDHGHRPSKLAGRDIASLQSELSAPVPRRHSHSAWVVEALERLRARDVEGLRGLLIAALYAQGLDRFVIDKIAPLTAAVGEEWVAGKLEVFEEHLFTELLVRVLRGALERISGSAGGAPRILLTTLPGEPHGLGLLMAECLMALGGATCLPLGVETPIADVVRAADAHGADVVALSFSSMFAAASARRDLAGLRAALPAGTTLWAGGSCPGLQGFELVGLRILPDLAAIRDAVSDWPMKEGDIP